LFYCLRLTLISRKFILLLMRVMALDYGTKNIGVALSDELQLTSRPLTTIRCARLKFAQVLERIGALVKEYEPGLLVVGLPLNLDGARSVAAMRVESFIAELRRRLTIPIVTIDERLTSYEAEQRLRQQGVKPTERRARSDEQAALVILQDYLHAQTRPNNDLSTPETSAFPSSKLNHATSRN
jgi:putative Holliday junction resolvase